MDLSLDDIIKTRKKSKVRKRNSKSINPKTKIPKKSVVDLRNKLKQIGKPKALTTKRLQADARLKIISKQGNQPLLKKTVVNDRMRQSKTISKPKPQSTKRTVVRSVRTAKKRNVPPIRSNRSSYRESVYSFSRDYDDPRSYDAELREYSSIQHQLLADASKSATIIVDNLAPTVTRDDLWELFTSVGPIRELDYLDNRSAAVEFRSRSDASRAIELYNGRELDDYTLLIKFRESLSRKYIDEYRRSAFAPSYSGYQFSRQDYPSDSWHSSRRSFYPHSRMR